MAKRKSKKNSSRPLIWKISQSKIDNDEEKMALEEAKLVAYGCDKVNKDGTIKKRNVAFKARIKKNDFFYLCDGSSGIRLLGQFIDDEVESYDKRPGWYTRKYALLKKLPIPLQYKKDKKTGAKWEPNGFSGCSQVQEKDVARFEKLILRPYFEMGAEDLYKGASVDTTTEKQTEDISPVEAEEESWSDPLSWSDPFQHPNPNPFQGVFTKVPKLYDREKFLSEVFIEDYKYDRLVRLLETKKNIILQGPPGVGKTFAAKRLAYSIIGRTDDSRVEFVQFHQNYSYEDFVMGYKPSEEKKTPREDKDTKSREEQQMRFELREGIFYKFCDRARKDKNPYSKYFLIVDEINRGNTSKIFGELLMLIESDHRGEDDKVRLAYRNEHFYVPKNLYIIGMMNTADRGLAMIDYALRRRFAFFEMEPAFASDPFKEANKDKLGEEDAEEGNKTLFRRVIERVEKLNDEITKSLGAGFRIGHSYFCGWNEHEDLKMEQDENKRKEILKAKMRDVVECDIIPTLEEYWFDNKKKVENWVKKLPSELGINKGYPTEDENESS